MSLLPFAFLGGSATVKAIEALPAALTKAGYYRNFSGHLSVRVRPAKPKKRPIKTLYFTTRIKTASGAIIFSGALSEKMTKNNRAT